jgi:hypothetical protein
MGFKGYRSIEYWDRSYKQTTIISFQFIIQNNGTIPLSIFHNIVVDTAS